MTSRVEATEHGIVYDPSYPDTHYCPNCGRDWINPDLPRLGMDTYCCSFPGCGWKGTTVDLALHELGLRQSAEIEEPEWDVVVHYDMTVSYQKVVRVRAQSREDAESIAENEVYLDHSDGDEVDTDDYHFEIALASRHEPPRRSDQLLQVALPEVSV